ncbi:isoprenyl transferase [Lachnoclostridium sp.]|uniref:isoprenyl transferase n=1 Tax=Lachnoclostridium sp. TaxID=2028282 RepID=UPI002896685E|nr:isoprenyl transferase [Lachnoclostridium sp.]
MDAKLNGLKIPNHIAIIMDGNGRWAKKRMMPRNYGHKAGSKIVEDICREAYNIGVKYVTVYAFSTENWSRPQSEIDTLMKLLRDFLSECLNKSKKNNMRVHVIGDITKLEQSLQDTIVKLEEVSASNTGLCFQVALNYGGQDEILRATRKIAQDVKDGKLSIEDLNTEVYEDYLDTKGIPAPDLLIRTSGEQRLSNFLLWQLAYTEFYFPEVLWPDFNKKELIKAIEFFNGRERRYGGVG